MDSFTGWHLADTTGLLCKVQVLFFFPKLSIPEWLRPKDADICHVGQAGSQLGKIGVPHCFPALQCPGSVRMKLGSGLEPSPVVQTQLGTVCAAGCSCQAVIMSLLEDEDRACIAHTVSGTVSGTSRSYHSSLSFSITSISVGQTW